MIQYAWLIPIMPLAAFAVIAFVTRPWKRVSGVVAVAGILAALSLAIPIFGEVLAGARLERSFDWLPLAGSAGVAPALAAPGSAGVSPAHALQVGFQVDPLTAVMLLVVTSVSFLVIFYSQGYMHGDPGYSRYFAFISLFCMSMLGLVLANSLLGLYIFWELVGLCSYLLIGFYYQKPEAAAAAKKAFLVTRLGDFGLLAGILLLWSRAGTLEFSQLEQMISAGRFDTAFLSLVGVLIFCGAVGKSAQFPLHVWLPDAMEGPTPVSALIHAATMVAAGVYLVARTFPIFEAGTYSLTVVMAVGAFTAIFAASMALVNNDIKRVMAYSTVSQLGYMFLALGVGARGAAVFHLMNHAFFKALLFLAAGSVIHALGSQDLRYMGGLRKHMKITSTTMLIAALSLSGFPLLTSGFWSKDEILAAAFDSGQYLVFAVALLTAFLTAFYMFRAWFLAFWGEPRWGTGAGSAGVSPAAGPHPEPSSPHHGGGVHESPWVMAGPLVILAIPSILSGFWGSPLAGGGGFAAFLDGHAEASGPNLGVMAASIVVALSGIWLAWLMYGKKSLSPERISAAFGPAYQILSHHYWVDELYNGFVRVVVLGVAEGLRLFDVRVVDGAVNGVAHITGAAARALRHLQTGRLQNYGWAMYAGAIAIAVVTIATQMSH
jgi:NADH-quinone oxidoreductase subunit L